MTFLIFHVLYFLLEISKRSVADPLPVIIGGEDCGDDSPDYCNGHLTGGKSYV